MSIASSKAQSVTSSVVRVEVAQPTGPEMRRRRSL